MRRARHRGARTRRPARRPPSDLVAQPVDLPGDRLGAGRTCARAPGTSPCRTRCCAGHRGRRRGSGPAPRPRPRRRRWSVRTPPASPCRCRRARRSGRGPGRRRNTSKESWPSLRPRRKRVATDATMCPCRQRNSSSSRRSRSVTSASSPNTLLELRRQLLLGEVQAVGPGQERLSRRWWVRYCSSTTSSESGGPN